MTTTPACFENLIGLAPCAGDAEPALGYLSDLEGLWTGSVAMAVDAKFDTAVAAVADRSRIAAGLVLDTVQAMLAQRGTEFIAVPDRASFCEFTSRSQTALFDGWQGLTVTKSGTRYGAHTAWRVVSLYIKSKVSNLDGVPVRIADAGGNVLWSATVPVLADVEMPVTVPAAMLFYGDTLYFGVNGLHIQPYLATCELDYSACRGCGGGYTKGGREKTFILANGFQGSAVGFTSYGVRACVEIVCPDAMGCLLMPELKRAVLLQTGVEVLKEWGASSRLNALTIKSKEWVGEKLTEWQRAADDYIVLKLPTIKRMVEDRFPECWECRQPFGKLNFLP